jgi:glycosyltransferase involved in cell wall biosynthesis
MASWLKETKKFNNNFIEQSSQEVMKPAGGTEILLSGLYKHTNISQHEDINMILSNPYSHYLRYTKKNLLWQHLAHSDESLRPGYMDPSFMSAINSFVYVSNWQHEKYRWIFRIPLENSYVIKNAIEPIEFRPKPKDGKIKLIYTSAPFRGLDMLLPAFEMLNRDDVELDIYSSAKIYGSGYEAHTNGVYEEHFEIARNTKNVNYMGYATNDVIKSALQEAHIFAYPSTFEETCCLAMVEAGAAGCRMVTTNLGALYETGSEYARLMPMQAVPETFIPAYAKVLNEEIDNYWSLATQSKLQEQSDFYNHFYSWEKRAVEWNTLFEKISEGR